MTNEEKIEMLEERIQKYEDLIEQILGEPKTIAVITAGPFKEARGTMYRVETDTGKSTIAGYKNSVMFGEIRNEELEIGTEIVIIKDLIVGVVPKTLKKIEKLPEFKLVTWENIGGLKSQIDRIRDAIETPLKYAKIAEEIGLSPIKGALLYGPPGCGKTLIAKAVASTILNATVVDEKAFIYVKGGELLNRYVGATEERIVNMFKECREYTDKTGKRAVIFIDEAEAILPHRGSRVSSDVDKTIVPTFLAEMDGFDCNSPFVLLATNHPDSIDSAILREGRIDIKLEIERPTEEDLKEIFMIHLSNVKCIGKKEDLAKAASELIFKDDTFKSRVSGSFAETVVKISAQKALIRKVKDNKQATGIITDDIVNAINSLN